MLENAELIFSTTPSINAIPKADWDNLFGRDIAEGFGYQKTLEEAGLQGFSFAYLLGRRNGRLIAIIPFFIMDFSFATLMPQVLRQVIASIQKKFPRFLRAKVLFVGMPTAEEFYLGIEKNEDLNTLLDKTLEEFRAFCKKEKIIGVAFHNLSPNNRPIIEYLKHKKFFKMETLPTTSINIKADSWEGYVSGLSKNTRKDLRRKLKKTASVPLRTEIREDIKDIYREVYKLYLNNFNGSDVRFETLTPEFFLNICKNMPGVAKYFLTFIGDKLAAFNLCLIKEENFIDKFIGFDREAAYQYHLYFTTFCHNLDWCIKNRIKTYQPGVSDYYPKIRLGAELIPLYIYSKARNPCLHLFLKAIAKFIEPKNIDPSLKKISAG